MVKVNWPQWPEIDTSTIQVCTSGLLNGKFSITGSDIHSLSMIYIAEAQMGKFMQQPYCLLTSHGSSAILLSLQALNIGINDEVILPALTWVGVATAILRIGAKPVFADSDENNPHMSFSEIERLITPRTKAIIAPHLYCLLFDIAALKLKFPAILIIEDASHCSGTYYKQIFPNKNGPDITIFSLQATKTLTCGEGGAILVGNAQLRDALLSLRNDSRVYKINNGQFVMAPGQLHGANYNLSDLQASLLLDQMEKYHAQCTVRTNMFKFFEQLCKDSNDLQLYPGNALTEQGSFYGLPCKLNCDENEILKRKGKIAAELNLGLWSPYVPIPFSSLYKPSTVKSYEVFNLYSQADFKNSFSWIDSRVIIPHKVFLSNERNIEQLFNLLSNKGTRRRYDSPDTPAAISVICIVQKSIQKIRKTIQAVLEQNYKGNIEIVIIITDPLIEKELFFDIVPCNVHIRRHLIRLDKKVIEGSNSIYQIAALRNIAVKLSANEYISFAVENCIWGKNHISSLINVLKHNKCSATYQKHNTELKETENSNNISNGRSIVFDKKAELSQWLFTKTMMNSIGFAVSGSNRSEYAFTEDRSILEVLRKLHVKICMVENVT